MCVVAFLRPDVHKCENKFTPGGRACAGINDWDPEIVIGERRNLVERLEAELFPDDCTKDAFLPGYRETRDVVVQIKLAGL